MGRCSSVSRAGISFTDSGEHSTANFPDAVMRSPVTTAPGLHSACSQPDRLPHWLLAHDILPALSIKLAYPYNVHRRPSGHHLQRAK